MSPPSLFPRSPAQTPPPVLSVPQLSPRRPCEGCEPSVVKTWIPIDVTATTCSTSSSSVWWSASTISQASQGIWTAPATPTTTSPTRTTTLLRTTVVTATATCCLRSDRWPVAQRDLLSVMNADMDRTPALQMENKALESPQPSLHVVEVASRFDSKGERFSDSADLLSKRWQRERDDVVTITSTTTSTCTTWAALAPTSRPTSIAWRGDDESCASSHWCDASKSGTSSSLDLACGCIVAWFHVLYGGTPSRGLDLASSVTFFFVFLGFFAIGALRTFVCRKNVAVLVNLLPVVVFGGGMVVYFATRAWMSNNIPTTAHIVASHAELLTLPLLLVDASLQLFGILSRRAEKGKWILWSSYTLRFCNLVVFFLYVIAACMLQNFISTWISRGDNCGSASSESLSLLPLVADWLAVCCLLSAAVLAVVVRARHCLAAPVLVHVLLVILCLLLHFLWRIIRDWTAQDLWDRGWDKWQPPASAKNPPTSAASRCWGILADGKPDWISLSGVRTGVESATVFYLLGIFPLVLALLLLYMVNLPVYLAATPLPLPPQPDARARYKMAFNAQSNRVEMVKVEAAAAESGVDAEGRPLYRLVRSGKQSWKFRKVKTPKQNGAVIKFKAFLFGWQ